MIATTSIPLKHSIIFWKNHKKKNRWFELAPGTLETALRFFSSTSAIAVLENEQLKTVEMNKPVNHYCSQYL